MIAEADARRLVHLWRTAIDAAVRERANDLLCAFIDQYDNRTDVVYWLLDVLCDVA